MSVLPDELRFRVAGILGYGIARALFATTRIQLHDVHHLQEARKRFGGVIFVLWHDQLLPLVHVHRHEGVVALVSEHADGEYVGRVLRRYGLGTVRGSSTRGGVGGLRKLVAAAREGRDVAVTPDGPRGPRHEIKEGALVAAQLSGLPLLPLTATATSAWRFDSWDRFMLPRPFATIRVSYGEPVPVARDAGRSERRRIARRVEATMEKLEAAGTPRREGDDHASPGRKGRGREEGRASLA